jgi:hypothetical protein
METVSLLLGAFVSATSKECHFLETTGMRRMAASAGREGEVPMVLVASVMIGHYYGFDIGVRADVVFSKSIVT